MASYTIELRNVGMIYGEDEVKSWFSDYVLSDFLTADEIKTINDRGTWSKERLANKIYNHYYMREIGFETPALFRQRVKSTIQEIMEEYLPLIYSAAISYDPLVNVDFTEEYDRTGNSTGNGQSTSTSNNNGNGLTINSDTPQGQVNKHAILNGDYASSTTANETTNTTNDNTTTNSNNDETEHYTRKTKGNSGVSATAQKMIEQYRDNIRAIDREIINKLEPLFMGIY